MHTGQNTHMVHNKKKIKRRNKNEILATHILEKAMANFFKFSVWGGLPGGYFCSKTGSNWMKDHGATKV